MTWITGFQKWLSVSESLNNAQEVANYFTGTDWTKESLSAMCGNMRHESSINPEMYEYGYDWSANRGYGLVQWTPRSKFWDWASANGLDPNNPNSQLDRISYEIINNIQWIANGHAKRYGKSTKYDISFTEFRTNSQGYTVEDLTEAFMWNYEGPNYTAGSNSLPDRREFALLCFNQLDFEGGSNVPGGPGQPGQTENKLYELWLSGVLRWG